MRALVIGLAAISAVLAGCDGSGPSASSSSASPAPTAQAAARPSPAVAQYDFAIYFCDSTTAHGGTCRRSSRTRVQIAAVRALLRTDRRIRSVLYINTAQQVTIAKLVLPEQVTEELRVGDLPSSCLVSLLDASTSSAVETTYRQRPGVQVVTSCSRNAACEVSNLRAAGVLH